MDVDYSRLCQAVARSRLVLRRYRSERREAVRQYVGGHWSDEGARQEVPVNLLGVYVSIVGRQLLAKNPRALLSSHDRSQAPALSTMQAWANQEIETLNLERTFSRIILDGLFSLGCLKIALATPGDAANSNWGLKAGQPFAARVDLDDLTFDVHAADLKEAGFVGHRYRVPYEVVRQMPGGQKTSPTESVPYNREGDQKIGTLGRGFYADNLEEFERHIDLWEIYLPRHQEVLTFTDDQLVAGGPPLRRQRWLGPPCGPYYFLAFGTVPGNPMPKAPIQDLIDLHEAYNRFIRKAIRQGDRQKQVGLVQGSATEDGARIIEADDGEFVKVNNPDLVKVANFGGPDANNLQLAVHFKDLFSFLGGGLEILGGRSPQSKTATQDQLLNQNAQAGLGDLQATTTNFISDAIKGLCWYWWHDPSRTMQSRFNLPGMPSIGVVRKVTPMDRAGRFEDLDIRVDPYSLTHQTPQQRLQSLLSVVKDVYLPMAQTAMQQGVTLDMNALFQKAGEYLDQPDLGDILVMQEPPQEQPGQSDPSGGGMPAETTRNYVRRSLGGDNANAREADFVNQMRQGAANGQPA